MLGCLSERGRSVQSGCLLNVNSLPQSHVFEHLVPTWWFCFERSWDYGLANRRDLLRVDLEDSVHLWLLPGTLVTLCNVKITPASFTAGVAVPVFLPHRGQLCPLKP